MQPPVAGILLAAGEGSRLGQPKALVEIAGERLVDRGSRMLRDGGADPIVVVTGAAPVDVSGALVVHNPAWASGMGSSLAAGLAALQSLSAGEYGAAGRSLPARESLPASQYSAAVMALADQPLVGAESVRRLIAAHAAGASIAVAAYDGRPRNPVLIAREHWPEVLTLARGDAGARPFLRAHPDLVTLIECGDTGSPDDIDTPADLARVTQALLRHDQP